MTAMGGHVKVIVCGRGSQQAAGRREGQATRHAQVNEQHPIGDVKQEVLTAPTDRFDAPPTQVGYPTPQWPA